MTGNDDFKDPFADFNDGFDKDGLDDDLDDFANLDNPEFLAEGELPAGDGFDEYGEPIISAPVNAHESYDNEQYEQPAAAPAPRAAAASQAPVQPKPFLKTPVGMFAVGAGALMVCAVGAIGYSTLGAKDQPLPALPEANNDLNVPRAGDPTFNAKTQPTTSSAAVLVEHKPVSKPALNLAESDVATPPAKLESAPPVQLQSVPGGSVDEINRLKAALSHQHEETEELKSVVATMSQGIAKISLVVEKDHAEQSAIREQLESLNKQLMEAPAPAAAPAKVAVQPANKGSTPAPAEVAKTEPQKAGTTQNPQAGGRYRLPGLKVVEATESGKMSVVSKTSNGRVYTLFKGEKLGTPRGSFPVTEIKEDGFLIFVGDKYYIDRVAEDKPVAVPVEAAKPVERAPAPSKPSRSSRSKDKASTASSAPAQSTSYTLNAVYENGNAFGLVNSNGDFKSYKLGDDVPGLGRITGLDANGNLKAGDTTIKSLY
jgi:hypothetical protein